MSQVQEPEFRIAIAHAISLRELRVLIHGKPTVRTLTRWHLEGRLNRHTRETIYFPAMRTPLKNGEMISTIAAYEWFVEELNRREPRSDD